jgi:hypothetical protein
MNPGEWVSNRSLLSTLWFHYASGSCINPLKLNLNSRSVSGASVHAERYKAKQMALK